MENQVPEQAVAPSAAAYSPTLWDGLSGVALVGGAIASSVLPQLPAAGVVPVAAAVGLHIFNRRQLQEHLLAQQAMASAQVVSLVNQNQATLQEYLQKFQADTQSALAQQQQALATNQAQLTQTLEERATALQTALTTFQTEAEQTHGAMDEKHEALAAVVNELRQMENCSHTIEADPKADAYYQRGLSHKRLGDRQEALRDFTEAIRLNGELADAYFHRGIVHAELGTRKQATDDLRQAYKLYFDQGDLDNYERARGLHKEFYDGVGEIPEEGPTSTSEELLTPPPAPDGEPADIKPLLAEEVVTTAANLFG